MTDMDQVIMGEVTHDVKVTRIGDGWNIRIYTNDKVNQEMRVFDKRDVGWAARYMLRWEDKCGNISRFATAARERFNKENRRPYGRVIYPGQFRT